MTEALSWLLIYSKSVEGTGIIGLLQQNKHVEKKTGNDAALEAEFQLLMTVSKGRCPKKTFFLGTFWVGGGPKSQTS